MPYGDAQLLARTVTADPAPGWPVVLDVMRALLVELDTRADRLADAAAERAALVRELAHVTQERDAALLALDSPNRSDV